MNLQIENPIILGRIEHSVPTKLIVIETDNNNVENPDYDIFGQVIVRNDEYYVFGDHAIHTENIPRYFEEYLKADWHAKK